MTVTFRVGLVEQVWVCGRCGKGVRLPPRAGDPKVARWLEELAVNVRCRGRGADAEVATPS